MLRIFSTPPQTDGTKSPFVNILFLNLMTLGIDVPAFATPPLKNILLFPAVINIIKEEIYE